MTVSGALARPMLAGMFIYGGVDAVRDPESKAKMADDVAPMIAQALQLPTTDTVTLVRINGAVQVVAGTMLASGKARRLSALLLAGSLLPTTYAGHRFWEEVDEQRRAQQRIQFLKNLAMLGGLILAAGDTGGRPSVPWRARRAARHAIEATVALGAVTEGPARQALASTRETRDAAAGAVASVTARATGVTAQAAELARAAWPPERASDLASELTRRARRAARKARKVQLSDQARGLAQAARESELSKRAVKAAEKAANAGLTRRALHAAKKAA